jgi:DNA ligase-1
MQRESSEVGTLTDHYVANAYIAPHPTTHCPLRMSKPAASVRAKRAMVSSSGSDSESSSESEASTTSSDRSSSPLPRSKAKPSLKKTKARAAEDEEDEDDQTDRPPRHFDTLAHVCQQLEETSGRLDILRVTARYLARYRGSDAWQSLAPLLLVLTGRIAPDFAGLKTGVGPEVVLGALALTSGQTVAQLRKEVKAVGDLGEAARGARKNQRSLQAFVSQSSAGPLTVQQVYDQLHVLAKTASLDRKKGIIQQLLGRVREAPLGVKFLVRLLLGNMRIGLAERGLLAAVALAVGRVHRNDTSPQSDGFKATQEALVAAYVRAPSFDHLLSGIDRCVGDKQHLLETLDQYCSVQVGVPLRVMLGKAATSVAEVLPEDVDAASSGSELGLRVEWKYDGERAQIHRTAAGVVSIFSRNNENNTSKYPELVRLFGASVGGAFVFDAEIVAWDAKAGTILPFQDLSRRKRKDVDEASIEVGVRVFLFDMLADGDTLLLERRLARRLDHLRAWLAQQPPDERLQLAQGSTPTCESDIQACLEQAVLGRCEGLMVKRLGETYTPDRRGWWKLKKDYLATSIGDTLDLVPIAAMGGRGKRTGVYGAFLMACYDADEDVYQSVAKLGTGFSEEQLREWTKALDGHVLQGTTSDSPVPKQYITGLPATQLQGITWFAPAFVWEVRCADLSLSPVHRAAVGDVHESQGIALRFPRFLRARPDKRPHECTGSEQVAAMFRAQANRITTNASERMEE